MPTLTRTAVSLPRSSSGWFGACSYQLAPEGLPPSPPQHERQSSTADDCDIDHDGIPNSLDSDEDGDGIPTSVERPNGESVDTDQGA